MSESATVTFPPTRRRSENFPLLEDGDHMDQETFHRLYEQMAPGTKAELVGGIVFMPSPQMIPHSLYWSEVIWWLTAYRKATPGTQILTNPTILLGEESEPQPDVCLRIVAPGKGQTQEVDKYVKGAPEMMVEVATTRSNIALYRKKDDYQQEGVKEYVVFILEPAQVLWFALRDGVFQELAPGADGILRSEVFPGLWLDPVALLALNDQRMEEVLRQGLASPEHAAFVAKLGQS